MEYAKLTAYYTPQRCEICDGEFKRPKIKQIGTYWICVYDLIQIISKAVRQKEAGEELY
jgi:hypothetical protein